MDLPLAPFDAGTDAGRPDSGVLAPADAGSAAEDAGGDAGEDSGVPDPGDAGPDAGTPYADGGSGPFSLRIVAANLSSGNGQSYDPGEGARILKGLQADIILVQELNFGANQPADLRGFVDTAFGPTFSYFREAGGQIPNGVISRYPIVASGEWDDPLTDTRDFAWARIDLPGPADLWAVSVHLLTSNAAQRADQVSALLAQLALLPPEDLVVLGGDFNTGSRTETCLARLAAYFKTTAPYPVDQSGNGNTNAGRDRPYDWVLADTQLQAHAAAVRVKAGSFPNGLVFDSRVYSPLSDVPPAQAGDSAAVNMQHMAVVRDFVLP
jgi:endonuclease/exonuclease/phosphatase family metal-dependent hydrolase